MFIYALLSGDCQHDSLTLVYTAYALAKKGYKVYGTNPLLLSTDADSAPANITVKGVHKTYADEQLQAKLYKWLNQYSAKCDAERVETATGDNFKPRILKTEGYTDTQVRICYGPDLHPRNAMPGWEDVAVANVLGVRLKDLHHFKLAPNYWGYFTKPFMQVSRNEQFASVSRSKLDLTIQTHCHYFAGLDPIDDVLDAFLPFARYAELGAGKLTPAQRVWMQAKGFMDKGMKQTAKGKVMSKLVSSVAKALGFN